jgi:hypothetical protein
MQWEHQRTICQRHAFVVCSPSQSIRSFHNSDRTMVHQYIRKAERDWSTRVTSIQTLDGKIETWWAKVSPSLKVNPTEPSLLTLQVMYHMSLCVLHSSIVPLFSWSSNDEAPSYASQLSAQKAFEHANSISAILASMPFPPSRLPGLASYTAYAACAIQVPFLRCLNPVIKQQAHTNVLTNIKVLRGAGVHWKFIELLVGLPKLIEKFSG